MLNLIMQAAPGGASGAFTQILPLLLIFVIFWFLLIRPQQQRMKKHKEMLGELKRGDEIVTNGGLLGKITKVSDDVLTIDLGEGNKVKAMRSMIADVRNRPEPANDTGKKK